MKHCFPCGLALLAIISGCGPKPRNYRNYLDHFPRSVLVLPPINESLEVEASGMFLSTITTALAEKGYYVLPVAVVDQVFKDNGVPLPPEMHQIPLRKLQEVFGADAILYITIKKWTTTYVVIHTATTVEMEYRLVDVSSGNQLWNHHEVFQYSASGRQNNIISMLIAAQIQAAQSGSGRLEREVAAQANVHAIYLPRQGLLTGARHPQYAKDLERTRRQQAKLEEHAARKAARR